MQPGTIGKKELGTIKDVVATLIALASVVERVVYAPAPVRWFVLWVMLRAEKAAYRYVYWVARSCRAPLQHPGPSLPRVTADPEDAVSLGWWFRAMAMALRDLLRRASLVRLDQTARRLLRLDIQRFSQRHLPARPAPDTS